MAGAMALSLPIVAMAVLEVVEVIGWATRPDVVVPMGDSRAIQGSGSPGIGGQGGGSSRTSISTRWRP